MTTRNRSTTVWTLTVVAIATVVLATTPLSVQAADLYWDSDDATPGAGGATPTGTWGTDSYWSTSADGDLATGAWTAGEIAVFAAGADAIGTYTVTATGAIDIGGLTFEEGDVTISGGSLRLVSNSAVAVSSGTSTLDTAIAEDIAGRTLTKSGGGTLVLSGTNTYSGGTVLEGGMLVFAADANLGDPAGGIVVNSDSALRPGTMTTDRTLEINNGAIAYFDCSTASAAVSFTMNGVVTGNGGVTLNNTIGKNNAYLIFASTSNTFTGPIMISGADRRAEFTFNSLADTVNPITFTAGGATREFLGFTWGSGATSPLVLDNRQIVCDGLKGAAQISNRNTLSSHANTITINTDLSVINTGAGKALTLSGPNQGDNTFAGVIGDGSSAGFGIKKTDGGKWILSGDDEPAGDRRTAGLETATGVDVSRSLITDD